METSGTANQDYFLFTVHNRFSRFVMFEGQLRVNASGYFYFKIKVENYNDLWGWLPAIRSVKESGGTYYLSNSACIEVEQSNIDKSIFTVQGNSNISDVSMISFWGIGY